MVVKYTWLIASHLPIIKLPPASAVMKATNGSQKVAVHPKFDGYTGTCDYCKRKKCQIVGDLTEYVGGFPTLTIWCASCEVSCIQLQRECGQKFELFLPSTGSRQSCCSRQKELRLKAIYAKLQSSRLLCTVQAKASYNCEESKLQRTSLVQLQRNATASISLRW